MDSSRNLPTFPGTGAWVPVEAAEQLIQQMRLLRAWSKNQEHLKPAQALLIKIELSEVEYLLDLDTVVPAERWQAVVKRIQLLTELLTSSQ